MYPRMFNLMSIGARHFRANVLHFFPCSRQRFSTPVNRRSSRALCVLAEVNAKPRKSGRSLEETETRLGSSLAAFTELKIRGGDTFWRTLREIHNEQFTRSRPTWSLRLPRARKRRYAWQPLGGIDSRVERATRLKALHTGVILCRVTILQLSPYHSRRDNEMPGLSLSRTIPKCTCPGDARKLPTPRNSVDA
ncbi:hypothetical protein DBV15_09446 [Temnothorax longispinosus]|uniref:Uncharacterized protein n=1 Tax=Temnothorax longispinosus TaxID=300112 RepID=A0A4S2K8P2_9HYME|nr:hypothetical protein DBV15_09446 [Temnothorax longispinosus]